MTEAEVHMLSTYNGERLRGLVHTDEWKAKMAYLQEVWNDWAGSPTGIIIRQEDE
jgi:hypothetical protein